MTIDLATIPQSMKARMVMRKIAPEFPLCPEGRLMFAIVECAMREYANGNGQCRHYLAGSIPHAAICGLDPDWIRHVMNKCGLVI